MTILNRPLIILKGEFGFLGLKNGKIEANRPTYDAFELIQAENGLYNFKGQPVKSYICFHCTLIVGNRDY